MNRYKFWDIFHRLPNGALTPTRPISVGGVTFGPGVSFSSGVTFGGIDFTQYQGKDIAADEKDGILVIQGIYQ